MAYLALCHFIYKHPIYNHFVHLCCLCLKVGVALIKMFCGMVTVHQCLVVLKMIEDKMTLDKMTVDKMTADKITEDKMTVDKMTLNKMTGQSSYRQNDCGQHEFK
jgi:pentapeptide MXKDX repeat protein